MKTKLFLIVMLLVLIFPAPVMATPVPDDMNCEFANVQVDGANAFLDVADVRLIQRVEAWIDWRRIQPYDTYGWGAHSLGSTTTFVSDGYSYGGEFIFYIPFNYTSGPGLWAVTNGWCYIERVDGIITRPDMLNAFAYIDIFKTYLSFIVNP